MVEYELLRTEDWTRKQTPWQSRILLRLSLLKNRGAILLSVDSQDLLTGEGFKIMEVGCKMCLRFDPVISPNLFLIPEEHCQELFLVALDEEGLFHK